MPKKSLCSGIGFAFVLGILSVAPAKADATFTFPISEDNENTLPQVNDLFLGFQWDTQIAVVLCEQNTVVCGPATPVAQVSDLYVEQNIVAGAQFQLISDFGTGLGSVFIPPGATVYFATQAVKSTPCDGCTFDGNTFTLNTAANTMRMLNQNPVTVGASICSDTEAGGTVTPCKSGDNTYSDVLTLTSTATPTSFVPEPASRGLIAVALGLLCSRKKISQLVGSISRG
jgi:hypothetical protein